MIMQAKRIDTANRRWIENESIMAQEIICIGRWMRMQREGTLEQRRQLATLLSGLHRLLRSHFVNENEFNNSICEKYPPQCEDVMFVCRQACSDQLFLIDWLERIIASLVASPVDRDTLRWSDMVSEVEDFFRAIDEHNDSEAASISHLTTSSSQSQPAS